MKSYQHTQQLLATRQAVLAALTDEPRTVADIAKACCYRAPAVAKHLAALANLGLARRGEILGIPGAGWMRDHVSAAAAPTDEAGQIADWFEERGMGQLLADVARAAGATVAEICGRSREARITDARHDVWTALEAQGFRRIEIARAFRRDHTTVGAGIAQADRRRMAREGAAAE